MGIYVNPPDMSKEEWLQLNARPVGWAEVRNVDMDDELPLMLIDNGPFTACAVLYDARERDYFLETYPEGCRVNPQLYVAGREALKEVTSIK